VTRQQLQKINANAEYVWYQMLLAGPTVYVYSADACIFQFSINIANCRAYHVHDNHHYNHLHDKPGTHLSELVVLPEFEEFVPDDSNRFATRVCMTVCISHLNAQVIVVSTEVDAMLHLCKRDISPL
jgi:hypothetical protein